MDVRPMRRAANSHSQWQSVFTFINSIHVDVFSEDDLRMHTSAYTKDSLFGDQPERE